jgi:hypothetical protein
VIDVDRAIDFSRVEQLAGVPYPIQLRYQSVIDAWTRARGYTRAWQRLGISRRSGTRPSGVFPFIGGYLQDSWAEERRRRRW